MEDQHLDKEAEMVSQLPMIRLEYTKRKKRFYLLSGEKPQVQQLYMGGKQSKLLKASFESATPKTSDKEENSHFSAKEIKIGCLQ